MTESRRIRFRNQPPASRDAGIHDRELVVDDVGWAVVEYGVGRGRADWCGTPHAGYVISGAVHYDFEAGGDPLIVAVGDAFVLMPSPRHRGRNIYDGRSRLFLIDALPASGSRAT